MRLQVHWKRRKRSDEDVPRSSESHLDIAIMRRMSLRDGEMKVILMAKGMVKPGKAITVDRDKATAMENIRVIANSRNRAQQEHAARKDNIDAQSQWVTNP